MRAGELAALIFLPTNLLVAPTRAGELAALIFLPVNLLVAPTRAGELGKCGISALYRTGCAHAGGGKRLRFLPMRRFCTGLTGQPRLYSFCYSLKKRCPYTPYWRPVQAVFCRSFRAKFRPEKVAPPIYVRFIRACFWPVYWGAQFAAHA